MENPIFRKKSLERLSSPESLNDYLHVTSPAVWLVLGAVILLLAGLLFWSSTAVVESCATGTAKVENGTMYVTFDDAVSASNVESGMTVLTGESGTGNRLAGTGTGNAGRIESVGTDGDGAVFALSSTSLPDGIYPVRVIYRQTHVLRLLFN